MPEEKPFITQKITGRKESAGSLIRFFLKSALGGLAFGAAAFGVIYCLGPFARARFSEPREPVMVAKDSRETLSQPESQEMTKPDPAETPAASPESQGVSGESAAQSGADGMSQAHDAGAGSEGGAAAASGAAAETALKPEEIRGIVKEELETYRPVPELSDLLKLNQSLRAAADQADQAVVQVTRVREGSDWFDNTVQTSGVYSGILVARTDAEMLVLTTEEAALDADALTVSLGRLPAMEAQVRRFDRLSGLAVLSVAVTEENEPQLSSFQPVELGNSYRLRRGDLIIALGSPLGLAHSASYGEISLISEGTSVTDGQATVFYTDADGNAGRGTWILNPEGELVGWVTDALRDKAVSQTAVIGISEFKAILERMMNGQASPLFGIHGVPVPAALRDQGIPAGIYVTDETRNSPAYEAGIQPGDIITSVGDTEITSMRDFAAELDKLHAEDLVRVIVSRNGREEYTPIEFLLRVGAR